MKLHAHHQAVLDSRGEWFAVLGDRRGFGGHRSGERMREVHARVARQRRQTARSLRESQRVPPDVRHLQPIGAAAQALTAALDRAQPGHSGASTLPSYSHCIPTQIPSSGFPASMPSRIAACQSGVSDRVAEKWPTPGTTTAVARSRSAGRSGREDIGAEVVKGLPDRRQVSCAVVNESDSHST